jgi:hypothetical protein
MIFAELQHDQSYYEVHESLVALLSHHFPSIESGLQGDSYVWVLSNDQKVAVDTFTSMHHEVKSSKPSPLANQVLAVLARQYQLRIIDPPESETHEEPEHH